MGEGPRHLGFIIITMVLLCNRFMIPVVFNWGNFIFSLFKGYVYYL